MEIYSSRNCFCLILIIDVILFFLIGISSMQGWTAFTMRKKYKKIKVYKKSI